VEITNATRKGIRGDIYRPEISKYIAKPSCVTVEKIQFSIYAKKCSVYIIKQLKQEKLALIFSKY
jgi:hypothetical protein